MNPRVPMPWEGLVERLFGPRRPGAMGQGLRDLGGWARSDRVPGVVAAVLVVVAGLVLFGDVWLVGHAAAAVYVLVAVFGLWVVVDQTGQPSLGHAAFMGIGAYMAAFLRLRVGLDGLLAALLAATLSGCTGWVLGWGTSRLRPAHVALGTWAFGWLVTLCAAAIPGGGGAISLGGPVEVRVAVLGVDLRFNDAGHLLLGAVVLTITMLLLRSAQRSAVGHTWTLVRGSPALAASLGYDGARVRRRAMLAGAALAGLAGALLAQLAGVVDPEGYSPLTSMAMFAAVLIGAPAGFLGPLVGVAATGGLPLVVSAVLGTPSDTRVQGLTVGALTLVVLVLSFRRGRRAMAGESGGAADGAPTAAGHRPAAARAPAATSLDIRDLRFSYGGVRALAGVTISVAAGTIHGVMGPNGSGKSTLLRCIAGALPAADGALTLGGRRIDGLDQTARVTAGVGRTFQHAMVLADMTAAEQVKLGLRRRAADGRWWQAALQTPAYRAEEAELGRAAREVLDRLGIGDTGGLAPETLETGRRRRLQVAIAVGTGPRVLLLDEPTAGMDAAEVVAFAESLRGLRDAGLTILVVEHNIRFLADTCDRVTVLDGGEVLAEGTPAEVAEDAGVRAVYLGSR